jgi:hypothetical protein
MTRFDISLIITDMQHAATAFYGSGNGHAWASGYLGSTLVDVLYRFVPEAERNTVLRIISENTRLLNARTADRSYDENVA